MIERLPKTWSIVRLGDAVDSIVTGFASGVHNQEQRGVPHLRPMNVSSHGEIDLSDTKYVEATGYDSLRSGDVLFNNTNSPVLVGKTAYIRQDTNWAYSNHMTRIRVNRDVWHPAWLSWYLHSLFFSGYFQLHCRNHVNQASINRTFLATEISVPTPPLPEQRRIVDAIEALFSRLDAAVAALQRVQANLKRYRAAVLKAACEGRLVPSEAELARAEGRAYEPASTLLARILDARRAQWQTAHPGKAYKAPSPPDTAALPELPEGWCWASVEQLAEVATGATPLRSEARYYEGGTVPWVTSRVVNAHYVDDAEEFITPLALKESNVKLFPIGSLLVAMYGEGKTRGKVSELRIEAATNQALAALIFRDIASKSCKAYLKLYFEFNYENIRRLSSGGVQPNLNLSIIKTTPVPIPPRYEQERIGRESGRLLSYLLQMDEVIETSLKRADRLRQAILQRAFVGQLVPQDGQPVQMPLLP